MTRCALMILVTLVVALGIAPCTASGTETPPEFVMEWPVNTGPVGITVDQELFAGIRGMRC